MDVNCLLTRKRCRGKIQAIKENDMILKKIYSKLETSKSIKELSDGLERLNVRSENGKKVDVFLHYEDGSMRWIPFKDN